MNHSKWKLIWQNNNNDIINLQDNNKIKDRSRKILETDINTTVQIYNGLQYFELFITKNMVGHHFGEFSQTRVKPVHKKKKKWGEK